MEIRTVILDGRFLLNAYKRNLDFISKLKEKGLKIAVVREEIQKLKDVPYNSTSSREDKAAAKKAQELFENPEVIIKTMGEMPVWNWLIEKGKEGFFIGTLESVILRQVPKKVTINRDNEFEVIDES